MSLVLGARMRRRDDGREGVVALVDGDRRIVWEDRGESRVALRQEVWDEAEFPRPPLRAEEKLEIALSADRALRAIDLHEPLRFWDKPSLADRPHDAGLVLAIIAYLSTRA